MIVAQSIGADAVAHGTAGFVVVLAIAKAAAQRELADIVEQPGERGLVDVGTQRAQARRVDHAGATGQTVQRARGRRVLAAAVMLAHRAGVL